MGMETELQHAAEKLIALLTQLRHMSPEKPPPQVAGISPSLMAIIEFVAGSPNCGIKAIARGLNLSPPSVSISVRNLEEAGLIARKPHPSDRRAVQIFLTPAGQELYDRTHAFRRQRFEKLLSGLTPEERATLLGLLEKALKQES